MQPADGRVSFTAWTFVHPALDITVRDSNPLSSPIWSQAGDEAALAALLYDPGARPAQERSEVLHRVLRVVGPLALLLLLAWLAPAPPEIKGLAAYLPLHTALEMFAIVVAVLAFAIGWAPGMPAPRNIVLLSCAFLGSSLLDFGHVLSYAGMPEFVTPSNPEKAIAFWLALRFLSGGTLLFVALSSWRSVATRTQRYLYLTGALIYTAVVYWAVLFHQDSLPRTFIPGQGLTPLKVGLEYLFVVVHLMAAAAFFVRARTPQPFDVGSLLIATLVNGMGGLFFTLYGQVTDHFNLLGHVYIVIAYGFICKAIFVDNIRLPYVRLLQSQQALREANQFNAALFEQNSVGIYVTDAHGVSLQCNPAHERLWQIPAREIIGKYNFRQDPQIQKILGAEALDRLFKGEVEQIMVEDAYVDPALSGFKQGRARRVAAALFSIKNATGQVHRVVVMQADITERQQAQRALQKERNFIATVLDTAGAMVIVLDSKGRILRFNRAAEQVSGYRSQEVMNKEIWEIYRPAGEREFFESAIADLLAGRPYSRFEKYCSVKDGGSRAIIWSNTAMYDEQGRVEYIICTGIDVTEARRAEEEAQRHLADLARVSRITMLGEMASAMAHELNQPLSAVVNYTQGCIRRMQAGAGDSAALQGAMEQASQQAQRASDIIRRIRDFMRKGEVQRGLVNLNELVRNVMELAQADVRRHSIQVLLDLAEPLPSVFADPIQIEQVILNLLRNAMDAMEKTAVEKRSLRIRTSVKDGGMVGLSVQDAGTGLSPEALDLLFTPFYTTKPEGMGLGLSISQSIVEAHGGNMRATINPQGGATFEFTLPVEEDSEPMPLN